MEIAKIIYTGDLRTECIHLKSGKNVITDAPVDNNGKGEAFSPTDLLCTSLGACMITIMGIVAKNNNIRLEYAELKVSKIMESNPRRVGEVIIEIIFPSDDYTAKEKSLLENAAKNCPVAKSLSREVKQTLIVKYGTNEKK